MEIFLIVMPAVFISGYLLVRYGLKVREGLLLIPVSLGTGMVLQIGLWNILLRYFPVPTGAWLALLIMLAAGIGVWYKNRTQVEALHFSYSRTVHTGLLVIWLLAGFVAYRVTRSYQNLDEIDHGPRAIMISRVGAPQSGYEQIGSCAYYHHAMNMADGVFYRLGNTHDLKSIMDIYSSLTAFAVMGLVFAFLWEMGKRRHYIWPAIGVFIFFTFSPAMWLGGIEEIPFLGSRIISHIRFFDYAQRIGFHSPFKQLPFTVNPWAFLSPSYALSSGESIGFWIPALLAFLAWLHLIKKNEQEQNWYGYLGLGQLVAITALYFETATPIVALPVGFYFIYEVLKARSQYARPLRNLLIFAIPAVVVIFIQGGFLTGTVFCSSEFTKGGEKEKTYAFGIKLKDTPAYKVHELVKEEIVLTDPNNWLRALTEWGIGPLLLPAVITFYAWQYRRKKSKPNDELSSDHSAADRPLESQDVLSLEALFILISITPFVLMPFTVILTFSPENNGRLATLPLWLIGLLSVYLMEYLWNRLSPKWAVRAIGRVAVILLIFTMTATAILNNIWFARPPAAPSLVLDDLDYQVMEKWQYKLDVRQDAVFDPSDDVEGFLGGARPIMIFATYGRNGTSYNNLLEHRPGAEQWEQTGLPGSLMEVGYTYLYLDRQSWCELSPLQLVALRNPDFYQNAGVWVDEENQDFRYLYQLIGDESNVVLDDPATLIDDSVLPLPADIDPTAIIFNPADGERPANKLTRQFLLAEAIQMNQISEAESQFIGVIIQAQYQDMMNLTETQESLMMQWRATRSPGYLKRAGVKYLLIPQHRVETLIQQHQDRIVAPDNYRQLYEINIQNMMLCAPDSHYILYEVTGDAEWQPPAE